jgi:predicted sulfurtransferase
MGKILLFYKYVAIKDTHSMMRLQRAVCQDLGLTGRIILAHEGINGTLGGSVKSIGHYKAIMQTNPLFADVDFKEAPGDASCFPKLRIVIKNEIVYLGVDPEALTPQDGGIHLTPQQAHELLANKPTDLVVLDTRNTYESRVGTFVDAVLPPIQHFREFPAYIDNNLEQFRDKEVLMFCTGGVRCERATAYLNVKKVAKKVYQIQGGIHRYIEQFPDGFFRGKNYVFDGRVTVPVTAEILGTCDLCATACDDFSNCLNASCNKHFIGCSACLETFNNTCSRQCDDLLTQGLVKKRPMFKKATFSAQEHVL